MRERVEALLAQARAHPEALVTPEIRHFNVGGVYLREMFMRAGSLVIGKLHLRDHAVLILGDVWVYDQAGLTHYEGYHTLECKAGVQRTLAAVTDTWVTTVHSNLVGLDPEEFERVAVTEDFRLLDAMRPASTLEH